VWTSVNPEFAAVVEVSDVDRRCDLVADAVRRLLAG
jgi:hypothetical protein